MGRLRLTRPGACAGRSGKAYIFQKSVYLPAALAEEEEEAADGEGEEEEKPDGEGEEEEEKPEEEVDWADADTASPDTGNDHAMWVAQQKPMDDDVEFLDLIFYAFPLMFLFMVNP